MTAAQQDGKSLRWYVGRELAGARTAAAPKITTRRLSELAGWSTSHIYAIEHGKAPADLDELEIMAGLYGVSVADIIARAEKKRWASENVVTDDVEEFPDTPRRPATPGRTRGPQGADRP